jgi:hypothetical protein
MPSEETSSLAGRIVRLAASAAVALSTTACPGSNEDPDLYFPGGSGGPCTEPMGIFTRTCSQITCHTTANPAAGLDLQSPGYEIRIVGQPAMGGGTLVEPGNSGASVLYTKLTAAPPFGLRMPAGLPPLSDAEADCIRDWIDGLDAMPAP